MRTNSVVSLLLSCTFSVPMDATVAARASCSACVEAAGSIGCGSWVEWALWLRGLGCASLRWPSPAMFRASWDVHGEAGVAGDAMCGAVAAAAAAAAALAAHAPLSALRCANSILRKGQLAGCSGRGGSWCCAMRFRDEASVAASAAALVASRPALCSARAACRVAAPSPRSWSTPAVAVGCRCASIGELLRWPCSSNLLGHI